MRLVQQGHRAEAEMLLARGDCNLHAQAASTGAHGQLQQPLLCCAVSTGWPANLALEANSRWTGLQPARLGGPIIDS